MSTKPVARATALVAFRLAFTTASESPSAVRSNWRQAARADIGRPAPSGAMGLELERDPAVGQQQLRGVQLGHHVQPGVRARRAAKLLPDLVPVAVGERAKWR